MDQRFRDGFVGIRQNSILSDDRDFDLAIGVRQGLVDFPPFAQIGLRRIVFAEMGQMDAPFWIDD